MSAVHVSPGITWDKLQLDHELDVAVLELVRNVRLTPWVRHRAEGKHVTNHVQVLQICLPYLPGTKANSEAGQDYAEDLQVKLSSG